MQRLSKYKRRADPVNHFLYRVGRNLDRPAPFVRSLEADSYSR